MRTSKHTGNLIITGVQREDDGSYVCEGTDWNDNYYMSRPVQLTVLGLLLSLLSPLQPKYTKYNKPPLT